MQLTALILLWRQVCWIKIFGGGKKSIILFLTGGHYHVLRILQFFFFGYSINLEVFSIPINYFNYYCNIKRLRINFNMKYLLIFVVTLMECYNFVKAFQSSKVSYQDYYYVLTCSKFLLFSIFQSWVNWVNLTL